MDRPNFLITLLIIFTATILNAQISPAEAVAGMGRGINLGNTLEPPFEGSWNNGPAQESYFDAYLDAGFSNIRIPVRWDQHTSNTAPFTIDETWMNRVEQVVDWGLSRGFYITLNGHHEDWLKNNYSNPTLRDRYDAIWEQVALRFQGKSEKLLFEIINEPNGMTVAQVDDLNERILGIIRQTNPTRIVIYGGNMYANSEQLLNAAIPEDDYLIGYYHAYDPWSFSGQGNGTWGTPNDYQQLVNKYQSVKNWSTANNIPIHHSEFGAKLVCDFNSRMRIYAHNVEQCIIHGFAFSVWDDGGDFKVLNRGNNTWPEVKDVLVHYHPDSPNQIFSTFSTDPVTEAPTVLLEWNNRTTSTSNIIVERSIAGTNNFLQVSELASDATSFLDENVNENTTYDYRMYTTRMDGTLLHGYPTRVRVIGGTQTPYNDSPIPIPGILEVEEYDNGGEGLSYHDTEPANIPNGFRQDEGVDIGAFGSGFILEYVAQGEWIEYTVNVAQAGTYSVSAELASEVSFGGFNITFDSNNSSTSFNAPNTGSWTVFETTMANQEIELTEGVQVMRLNITSNNPFNIDRLEFNLEVVNASDLEVDDLSFKVGPNPTDGLVQIQIEEALVNQNPHLEIFNMMGEKMGNFKINGSITNLDLSHLVGGIYMVQLVKDNLRLERRVVIH